MAMHTLVRCPGVLAVERDAWFGYVRWEAPAIYVQLPHKIDDWKSQRHLVEKASLTPAVCDALSLIVPDAHVLPTRRLDRAMLAATPLVIVGDGLRAPLLDRGVRVWTVGYHRNPGRLRLIGQGGAAPTVWIEQVMFSLFDGPELPGAPVGRPKRAPWYGWSHDADTLDRVLRAASGGALSEPAVLLADEIARGGWGNLHAPADARRRDRELIEMIDADPQEAEECCYADLRWASHARWNDTEDAAATPALARAVAELASAAGPERVIIEGVGEFWREVLPAMTLRVETPGVSDGWLPPVSHDAPPSPTPSTLRLPATHRYARHLGPGAWWEI
jgi:hypothetical protein